MGPGYSSLVHAFQAHNVTIDGGGTLNGDFWWEQFANKTLGGVSRPHMIHLVAVHGLRLEDIAIRRSPSWTLHLTFCDDVVVDDILVQTNDSVKNGGNSSVFPCNADGIDVDSTSNVVVRNSQFYTSDDSIALKSGKDWFGRAVGRPTQNVSISNCTAQSNDGALVIGSEMNRGLHDIVVEGLTCLQSGICLWISRRATGAQNRGGAVERMEFEDIHVPDGTTEAAVDFDMCVLAALCCFGDCTATASLNRVGGAGAEWFWWGWGGGGLKERRGW